MENRKRKIERLKQLLEEVQGLVKEVITEDDCQEPDFQSRTEDLGITVYEKRKVKLSYSYLRRVMEDAYDSEGVERPDFRVEEYSWKMNEGQNSRFGNNVFLAILTDVRVPYSPKIKNKISYRLHNNCEDFREIKEQLDERRPITVFITSSVQEYDRVIGQSVDNGNSYGFEMGDL